MHRADPSNLLSEGKEYLEMMMAPGMRLERWQDRRIWPVSMPPRGRVALDSSDIRSDDSRLPPYRAWLPGLKDVVTTLPFLLFSRVYPLYRTN